LNFDQAFERLIGHEGGLSEDPNDPGGVTKYGISQRVYPNVDIKALTLDEAKAIYKRDYWKPMQPDALPDGVRFDLFDMAVNSGLRQAVKTLQRAVGAEDDGVLGMQTLKAVRALSDAQVVARFNGARLMFMTDLKTWPHFSRGWARRIASNLMEV
jgi:lysozyme family protein